MIDKDRRKVLVAFSGLWLSACGGEGADALADGVAPSVSTQVAPSAPASSAESTTGQVPAEPSTVLPGERLVPSVSGDLGDQFRVWDAGSGPSANEWSRHLSLRWKHAGTGDWIDADGVAQGDRPYSTAQVDMAQTWVSLDATALVERWRTSGANKGFTLRVSGRSSPTLRWAGRESAQPPRLQVRLDDGRVVECPCRALAGYAESSLSALDTRLAARTGPTSRAILQFDLAGVVAPVESATVALYCIDRTGTFTQLDLYECDPPRFQLAASGTPQVLGLAAQVGEAALRGHPDVIRAGDFSNLERGVLFDGLQLSENSVNQQLPDPDAPGTVMFRGSFTPLGRGSFSGKVETMRANLSDPLRPPAVVETEMHCRLYVFLEDDWRSTRDANKMAIGWDLRMGWWNDAQGGYWQSTTGNGGARGTGLKLFAPAKTNGGSQSTDRWEYQGHSIRMEAGLGTDDGNPYEGLRPLESYVYHLDQPTGFGQVFRLGGAVLQRGRWHCLEQQVSINSITGPFDALGNGEAVPDGLLRTWVDGVLVSEVGGLRWRRHPEMGIQGPWINWFYGGKQATERTMHYRMNHLVVARRYIGPRRG
jgi:hypothetical protein